MDIYSAAAINGEGVAAVLLTIAGLAGGGWLTVVLIVAAIGFLSGKKK